MTQTPTPPRFVHRGHIPIVGFYYATREEQWARRDILARHVWGARVYRHQDRLLVLFPKSQRFQVERCPDIPLVSQEGTTTSLPLPEGHPRSDGAVLFLAQGGHILSFDLNALQEIEPSRWLELDGYSFEVGQELQPPPPPLRETIPIGPTDTRELLDGVVGKEHPDQGKVIRSLQFGGQGKPSRKNLLPRSQLFTTKVLAGFAGLLGRFFSSGSPPPGQLPASSQIQSREPQNEITPGWWRRMASAWKALIWKSKLGTWLAREHVKYLGELFELLDDGSYEEALRRAIPTGGKGGSSEPSLLPFGRRETLELGRPKADGSSLGLREDLYARLQNAYRGAFRDLDRQGRHHEAAFVLSELLQQNEEAVAYLERNGLLRQAAQLAEARELPSGMIVRLWFRAGDRERAIAIARRDGAFEDALVRLKNFPEEEKALRLLWAEQLAAAGNYAGAVEIASAVPEAVTLCQAWLKLAIAQGGTVGARALVLQCKLGLGHYEEIRTRALELLGSGHGFDSAALVEMARILLQARHPGPAERALARCLVRVLLRDRGRGLNGVAQKLLKELAALSGDGALTADIPALSTVSSLPRLANRDEPMEVKVSATDVGVTSVFDAVFLEGGRYMLAKGEAGVFLFSRRHKQIHHFNVPCERLVVSDTKDRVLAVSRRGERTTVSQIEVSTRRASRWSDLAIGPFSTTFDGQTWYVAMDHYVHALDVTGTVQSTLWRSGDAEANVLSISRTKDRLLFSTGNGECWEHDLAPHRLRRRAQTPGLAVLGARSYDIWLGVGEEPDPYGLCEPDYESADGEFENPIPPGDRPTRRISIGLFRHGDSRNLWLGRDTEVLDVRVEDATEEWIAVSCGDARGTRTVVLVDRLDLRTRLRVALDDTPGVSARLGQDTFLVADQRGRILGFEIGAGTQLISHRV